MTLSRYRIQIVDRNSGDVVIGWQPGDRVEADLTEELIQRVKARGVGLFRTEGRVLDGVRDAFMDLLFELKRRV